MSFLSLSRSSLTRRNLTSTSGMVLIMTLVALAVMTILLLALFQGASHQVRGAQGDASLAREQMLADSAVALVIGQIQQASTQTNQTWISQPGLLRTYSTNAVRIPTACYKLYSTTNLAGMSDTSGNLTFFSTDIPANWNSEPNQYTDLNAPEQTPGLWGQSIYPILDPGALTNAANSTAGIEGVSSDLGTNVTMPVAWLYELQDGTLGLASNGTAANPIVARIAFWTDDDSCKININTAGCGSPWNTPRVNSTQDVVWSTNQPAEGEYSAYPGHPATTSLAAVFGTNSFSGTNAFSPQQLLGLTPRYAWGGSEFETQPTMPGEVVSAKLDRLYASLDELCFTTNLDSAAQRQTNIISPALLEIARFVLTAHSNSPETTLLGEPRIAIWPVAATNSPGALQLTAADCAITNVATVGAGTTNARSYFFQRYNALSPTDDLNTNKVPSNAQLFNDLVNRGNLTLPGYGTTIAAKYPGAEWTQILLEIADYIRCINAVDPSPAPFVSYAAGNPTNGVGLGFVDPLMTTYAAGTTNQVTLRGMGRSPTLSSLTLIFYVCGFGFKNGTHIDYEETPDTNGASWTNNFLPTSTNWANVNSERIRAFVVPCTYQPACAYPEVSDACMIQITGLNNLNIKNSTSSSAFGFQSPVTSPLLSDALKMTPTDRAWGGNEGPLAWRAEAAQTNLGAFTNIFAATNSFPITLASSPTNYPMTGMIPWPAAKVNSLVLPSAVPVTVLIQDINGNTLQTLTLNFPSTGFAVPNPVAEYSQDGSGNAVYPSYYMTLKNRVLLTGTNREFLIQPGDVSRSVAAATDLRVITALTNVPSSMFAPHPLYSSIGSQHAHFLYSPDGKAIYGAAGTNSVFPSSIYSAPTSSSVTWTNWCTGALTNYAWPVNPPCSVPTGTNGVYMATGAAGDWDTGLGFSPDGAQINLPDSGTTNTPANAYFSLTGGCVGAPTQRTANALVPSPVIFGSLPAGINPSTPSQSEPWRTLLFCPYPAASTLHPGFGNATTVPPIAPDHLILDNFWMPVIEPYAISTCLTTSGKINLNDQIAPFTYLHRNTALHALLNDLRIPAICPTNAASYKSPGTPIASIWNSIDENETIAQIENMFANSSVDAYLSESEICTVPLVPQGLVPPGTSVSATQTALNSFWYGYSAPGGLTGQNLRDLPYAQLYGRLTTRSNSYTVHVRVQVLQKLPHDPNQNVWNEGVDLVLGDWRGSYEIERYLDPAALAPAAGTPLGPYKYRIISARQFAP